MSGKAFCISRFVALRMQLQHMRSHATTCWQMLTSDVWLAQELLHLDLSGTAAGDSHLIALRSLPRLQTLLLNDQPILDDIGDSGLFQIGRIPALRRLEVRGNARITAAGAAPMHACIYHHSCASHYSNVFPQVKLEHHKRKVSLSTVNAADLRCHPVPHLFIRV